MSESETDPGASDGAVPAGGKVPTDYETATARLDEIIARLDSGDAQLRETLDLCAEARTLIEYCAAELAAVDEGLKELRLDELAASLQSAGPAQASAAEPGSSVRSGPAERIEEFEPAESVGTSFGEEPPPPEEPPF